MKMYSENKNWNKQNFKKSFKNLENDGYSFDKLKFENWFMCKMETWQHCVLSNITANKVILETEKALLYSIVNQYGKVYEMWFPKSALVSC